MAILEIHGDWSISRRAHKQKWAMLADDDLRSTEGTPSELYLHMTTPDDETRAATAPFTHKALCGGGG